MRKAALSAVGMMAMLFGAFFAFVGLIGAVAFDDPVFFGTFVIGSVIAAAGLMAIRRA